MSESQDSILLYELINSKNHLRIQISLKYLLDNKRILEDYLDEESSITI